MPKIMNFYMDDSGTRHPDYDQAKSPRRDWFALGGILILEADEPSARERIAAFRQSWPEMGDSPLHSCDIRHRAKKFHWLERVGEEKRDRFLAELSKLLLALPAIGVACVIDRPGYDSRYREKYGRDRWSLCKTAFMVAVERAAKYAASQGARLRVMPEKCSKKADAVLKGYYGDLKSKGHPFDAENAARYGPMTAEGYRSVLYEFRTKAKSSPMTQIADLYLWPMCVSGYHLSNRPYVELKKAGRLIDCHVTDIGTQGIKYSCFDKVTRAP